MVIHVSLCKVPSPIPQILKDCGFSEVAPGLYLGQHLSRLLHDLEMCSVLPKTLEVGGGRWAVAFPDHVTVKFRYDKPACNPIEATLRAFRQVHKAGVIVGTSRFLVRDPIFTRPLLASQGFKRQGHLYIQTKAPWLTAEVDEGRYGSQQITLRIRQQELFNEQAKKGS